MLKTPAYNEDITAQWGRALIEQVNRSITKAGAGLQAQISPNGTTLSVVHVPQGKGFRSPIEHPFKITGSPNRNSSGNVTGWNINMPPGCLQYGARTLDPLTGLSAATLAKMPDLVNAGQELVIAPTVYTLAPRAGQLAAGANLYALLYGEADDPQFAFVAGTESAKAGLFATLAPEEEWLVSFKIAEVAQDYKITQLVKSSVILDGTGGNATPDRGVFRVSRTVTEGTNPVPCILIHHNYYQVGGLTGLAADLTITDQNFTGMVYLEIRKVGTASTTGGGFYPVVQVIANDTITDPTLLFPLQQPLDVLILPIYQFVDGAVELDFRYMPNTGIVEFFGAAQVANP